MLLLQLEWLPRLLLQQLRLRPSCAAETVKRRSRHATPLHHSSTRSARDAERGALCNLLGWWAGLSFLVGSCGPAAGMRGLDRGRAQGREGTRIVDWWRVACGFVLLRFERSSSGLVSSLRSHSSFHHTTAGHTMGLPVSDAPVDAAEPPSLAPIALSLPSGL